MSSRQGGRHYRAHYTKEGMSGFAWIPIQADGTIGPFLPERLARERASHPSRAFFQSMAEELAANGKDSISRQAVLCEISVIPVGIDTGKLRKRPYSMDRERMIRDFGVPKIADLPGQQHMTELHFEDLDAS